MIETKPQRLQGRIKEVSIRGFRSLKSIERLQLPQLTVLIGANGVGKSNFIGFFEMLGWMLRAQNLQEFVFRRGGGDDQFFMGSRATPRIAAELRIATERGFNDYCFEMAHLSAGDTLMLTQEAYRYSDTSRPTEALWTYIANIGKESSLPEQKNTTAQTIYHLLRQCATYQFHNTTHSAALHQRWDIAHAMRLRSDAGNLAPILLDLCENDAPRYHQIVQQIQQVLPAFDDFVLEPVAGKVLLRWRGRHGDKTFGTHLTSDGTLRLFGLTTLLNLADERLPDMLFFDEPELGLHPQAIVQVAQMMQRIARTRQVFISTQSTYLVDCFDLDSIIVAETSDGATALRNLPREEYEQWLDDDYLPGTWPSSRAGVVA